jgi:hypothetical protein
MTTFERIAVPGATGQRGRPVIADLLKIAPTPRVIGIVRNAAARFRPGRSTMTIRRTTALAGAAGALCLTFGLCAAAQEAPWYNGVTVFEHAIPSTAGKSMVAVVVNYPPGGKIGGPSPCPVGLHLRSRALRRHSQPGQR